MSDARLIELETKLAHQEHAVEILQQTLYEQQKDIARLETALTRLSRLFEASGVGNPDLGPHDERPPHY